MSSFPPSISVSGVDLFLFKMPHKSETRIDLKKSNIKQPKFYTPFTTKPPFLLTILCALLACIALLETALENGTKIESNSDGIVHQAAKYKRQAASSTSPNGAAGKFIHVHRCDFGNNDRSRQHSSCHCTLGPF